jgi:1-acyl-sn-glycerol-3-phosphate acyltransferase
VADRSEEYHIISRVIFLRWLLRLIFRLIFRILGNVSVTGLENIPKNGAYIIAINHISIVDPPFVVAFWPQAPEVVGAKEIWERKGQSTLIRLYGGIRVHRGEYDRNLLETMIKVIESGRPLLIAPEGGRSYSPGLRPALPGVAYLADKTKAPILPVGIIGSTDDFLKQAFKFKRPHLYMRIGEPIFLPPIQGRGETRKVELKRNADLLMYEIAALLPPDYQGVYAIRDLPSSETS